MESNELTMRQELREAERGEAVGWTGYRFPAWSPIAMAAWAGSFSLGLAYLDGTLGAVWSLAHLAIMLVYIWWDRRTQAAFPSSKGPMPPEYRRSMVLLYLTPLVLVPVAFLVGYYVVGWAGAAVAAIGWGSTVWIYNRAYARASAAVRERLA